MMESCALRTVQAVGKWCHLTEKRYEYMIRRKSPFPSRVGDGVEQKGARDAAHGRHETVQWRAQESSCH
jgi:hypothetical protein